MVNSSFAAKSKGQRLFANTGTETQVPSAESMQEAKGRGQYLQASSHCGRIQARRNTKQRKNNKKQKKFVLFKVPEFIPS